MLNNLLKQNIPYNICDFFHSFHFSRILKLSSGVLSLMLAISYCISCHTPLIFLWLHTPTFQHQLFRIQLSLLHLSQPLFPLIDVFLLVKFFSRQWILPFSPVYRSRPAELKTAQENTFKDFPGGSDGKVSAYVAGDPGSIRGLGRAPRKGNGNHSTTLAWKIPWTDEPGRLHSPWGRKESDTTERLHFQFKENPYMCWSCLI